MNVPGKKNIINKHNGHDVTCLCCEHFRHHEGIPCYEHKYIPPEISIYCMVGGFSSDEIGFKYIFNWIHDLARNCEEFIPLEDGINV